MDTDPSNIDKGIVDVIVDGCRKLYKVNQPFSIVLIVFSICSGISNLIPKQNSDQAATSDSQTIKDIVSNISAAEIALSTVIILSAVIILMLASVLIQGALTYTVAQAIKGRAPSITEATTAAKNKFWQLFLLDLMIFWRVLGGLLLFIIPGIRASLRYSVAPLVLFIDDTTARESIVYARTITTGNLLKIFIYQITVSLVFPLSYFIQYGALVELYPYLKARAAGYNKPTAKNHS